MAYVKAEAFLKNIVVEFDCLSIATKKNEPVICDAEDETILEDGPKNQLSRRESQKSITLKFKSRNKPSAIMKRSVTKKPSKRRLIYDELEVSPKETSAEHGPTQSEKKYKLMWVDSFVEITEGVIEE